jgi:methionine-gamma-lyase
MRLTRGNVLILWLNARQKAEASRLLMTDQPFHLRTTAVHAGRRGLRGLVVHAPPIDLSTTYPLPDPHEAESILDDWAAGSRSAANPIYVRVFNPTVARFEEAIAALEGTTDAVAFASGMAALSAVLLATRERGGHVVAVRPLYGTSDHLLDSKLLGVDVSWAHPHDIASAIKTDTALIILETPQNPTLGLVDIAAVVGQAGMVSVLVDNTFATPVLQRPARLGASLVLHSATKFIGGHGDAVGGVVACGEDWARPLRQIRFATGGILHPFAAYLLHRSIPTLPLRVEAAQATAAEIANRLSRHPAVLRVLYPGFDSCFSDLRRNQMTGPGSLLTIDLGSAALARHFVTSVELALHAVSLGTFDTLVEVPSSLTHRIVDPAVLAGSGISDGLVRISIGLEAVEDLWSDFDQALAEDR